MREPGYIPGSQIPELILLTTKVHCVESHGGLKAISVLAWDPPLDIYARLHTLLPPRVDKFTLDKFTF